MIVKIGYADISSVDEFSINIEHEIRNGRIGSAIERAAEVAAKNDAVYRLDILAESIESLGDGDMYEGSLDLAVGDWFNNLMHTFSKYESVRNAGGAHLLACLSYSSISIIDGDSASEAPIARYSMSDLMQCALAAAEYTAELSRAAEEARKQEQADKQAAFESEFGKFVNPKSGKQLQVRVIENLLAKAGLGGVSVYSSNFATDAHGRIEAIKVTKDWWATNGMSDDEVAAILMQADAVLVEAGFKCVMSNDSGGFYRAA